MGSFEVLIKLHNSTDSENDSQHGHCGEGVLPSGEVMKPELPPDESGGPTDDPPTHHRLQDPPTTVDPHKQRM